MTKRDAQAREYAAESYEKTPAERGVSNTFDLITDANDFLLDMATRRVARTHYEGCRTDHVECLVAALVVEVTRPTLTDEEREALEYFAAFHRSPREGDANAAATLRSLLERTK
jgi:hypothetical protein